MDLMNDSKGKKTNCECKDEKVQQGEKGPPSERTKGLIPAVPPVLKNVGKLAAGVAGMASGSATEKNCGCRKCKANDCKFQKKTTGTPQTPKNISASIEYGTTEKNDYKNKLQIKEPVVNNYLDTKNETICHPCNEIDPEDKSKNLKVKFQEPIHLCPKRWATFENQCSAMKTNTQIDCNETNDYAHKSHQCPNAASNDICFKRRRYKDLINKEDIVYSCDVHGCNNVNTEIGTSTIVSSSPHANNYFGSYGKPETLNQSNNLCKLNEGTSGFDKSKNECNKNSCKNPPGAYSETKDSKKLQLGSGINSTNNTKMFGAQQTPIYGNFNRNTPKDNLKAKNLLPSQMDKPGINSTYAPLLSNNNDLLGFTDRNLNKNAPNYISEPKNLPSSQINDALFSKTSTYENSNKKTPYENLDHRNLLTPQMVKPEISFTENNSDLPSTSKTPEYTNKIKPNDDLESIYSMNKPEINLTKNVDLFVTSKRTNEIDKPEFGSTKPLLSNNIDLFESYTKSDIEKAQANTTKSAPTFSNNIDLFETKNKDLFHDSYIQKKYDEKLDANNFKQNDPIDLFANSNFTNSKDANIIQDEVFMNSEELDADTTVNTTKSAPLFSNNIDLFSTLNKDTYKNNNETVKNNMGAGRPSTLKFSIVDVSDLSYLPEIGKNTKYDPYFIHRRSIGVNNCKCKILVKKNGTKTLLDRESCNMYTTMLGMNACSHVGNPRNKTALQPGHSLMDWIRLSHSGKDLTGVGPRAGTLSVSHKQLAEHNTENDAWIAIRGKVYNITAYFDFHPGGKEELMKGVGQDATQMFNSVHPWVNYESILQKCLVGRLTSVELDDDEVLSLFYGRSNQTIQVPKNYRFLSTAPITNANGGLPIENIVNPKFDWVQQLDYITTIFSTKPLSNAQVQVTAPTKENKLEIIITYCNHIFKNYLHFSNNIHWPCKVTINWDTGKVEVNFRKIISKIWDTYGSLTQESEIVSGDYEYEKIKYIVLNNVKENHNTHLIAFQRIDGVKQTIPIGFHVKVYGTIDDQELIRCYTPVPCSFMRRYSNDYEAYRGDVCLLIKKYPEGLLSPTICNSVKGDIFELSPPLGVFDMEKVASRSGYLFLAAGSGITPMLGTIKFILESTQIKCEKMHLLYFNRTEEDILLRKHFDSLRKSEERVIVKYILSQPPENWSGLSGHIDLNLLKTSIDELCTNTQLFPIDIFSLICGPLVFTNLAKSMLIDIGYTDENIHLFGA